MDTIEKLQKMNEILLNIIATDNSKMHLLTEEEEMILLRIHLEIFNISHKDISDINSNKEE